MTCKVILQVVCSRNSSGLLYRTTTYVLLQRQ